MESASTKQLPTIPPFGDSCISYEYAVDYLFAGDSPEGCYPEEFQEVYIGGNLVYSYEVEWQYGEAVKWSNRDLYDAYVSLEENKNARRRT